MSRRSLARRRRNDSASTSALWLLSFSDLLTLLLTAFVLRFAMSSFDTREMEEALQAKSHERITMQEESLKMAKSAVTVLKEKLGTPVKVEGDQVALRFGPEVTIELFDTHVALFLGGGHFESGKRELLPETKTWLLDLCSSLLSRNSRIKIEGHTDNIPIMSAEFPSNWELSAARAISVAKEMQNAGVLGQRISVVGYADTKPRASNATEEGRALNRRVEIKLFPVVQTESSPPERA